LRKAGKTASLAHGAHAIAPAGENLVRVGLVTDVPDEPIRRRVEHVVKGDGELHDAQARAEVPAGQRNGMDQLRAQLVGNGAQCAALLLAQVRWDSDGVEKWCGRDRSHQLSLSSRERGSALSSGATLSYI